MFGSLFLLNLRVNPLVAGVCVTVLLAYVIYKKMQYRLPPGPLALPLIGNAIQLYFLKKKLYKTCVDWAEYYGPIFSLHLGWLPCVIVNNAELFLEATVKKPTDFAGRMQTYSSDLVSQGGKDIAMANISPTWHIQRKLAFQALRNSAVGSNLERHIHASFKSVVEAIDELNGAPFYPDYFISLMVYNFFTAFCYGEIYKIDDEHFKEQMELSTKLYKNNIGSGLLDDIFPFLRHFPSARRERRIQLINEFLSRVREKYDRHRENFNPDNIRDFIDELLLAQKQAKDDGGQDALGQLTDTHFFQTVIDIIGAGKQTSTLTVLWTLYYMVKYPTVQKKVQKELDEVVGRDRLPGLKDKDALLFTTATLMEIMRLSSITPLGFPHMAVVDGTLGGYDIPKGTLIFFNEWALHKDPKYWPDPEKFDPNRFIDSDCKLIPKPMSWIPFSAGRRSCVGETVARPQLLLMFACFLHVYDLTVPPGEELPTYEERGALSNTPPKSFRLVATLRK